MNFVVKWIERKTSQKGTPYSKATLVDEQGNETADVSIFSSFPNYANLMNGQTVTGELKVAQNGRYTNKTLEYPSPAKTNAGGAYTRPQGGFTTAKAKEVIDYKDEKIDKNSDRKELGIKISSTMRMAVDCALAEFKNNFDESSSTPIQQLILKWRKWLWENWSVTDSDFEPFRNSNPYSDSSPDDTNENM